MAGALDTRVAEVLAALEREAQAKVLAEMGPRYGIQVKKAFGVPMAKMQAIAKQLDAITRSPPRFGKPAGTRRAWWRAWWMSTPR